MLKKPRIKLNYPIKASITIIFFLIILINFSAKPESQVINDFIQYQNDHEDIPAVEIYSVFTIKENEVFQLPKMDDSFNSYIQRDLVMGLFVGNNSTRVLFHFIDQTTWSSILQNSEYEMLLINNGYYNSNEVESIKLLLTDQFSLPISNGNQNMSVDDIGQIHNLPAVMFNRYSHGMVNIIMSESAILDMQFLSEMKISFVEHHYFNHDYINSVSTIEEIKIQTLSILNYRLSQLSNLNYFDGEHHYTKFINELLQWEQKGYANLELIFISSSVKILFIEYIAIIGYYLWMKNRLQSILLNYYRGNSFKTIRKQLSLDEIKNFIISTLSGSTVFLLNWTDLQKNYFFQIIIPWLFIFLFSSLFIIYRIIRISRQKIHSLGYNYLEKEINIGKPIGMISSVFGALSIINILLYPKSVFHSYFLVFLFWFSTFAIIYVFVFISESDFVTNKINKFSSTRLLLRNYKKRKFILLFLVIMISANAFINQQNNYDLIYYENNEQIKGNMGDFTLIYDEKLFSNAIGKNFSKFSEVIKLQSAMPVYQTVVTLYDEDSPHYGNQITFTAELVNQSTYDSFICDNCAQINKNVYFKDKLWIGKTYIGPFISKSEIELIIDEDSYFLNSDDFSLLDDKPGIMGRGVNKIVSSVEAWKSLGLPVIDLRIDTVIISFSDKIDIDTAKNRIADVLGVIPSSIWIYENVMTTQESSIAVTNNINKVLNTIFNIGLGLIFMYYLIDEQIIKNLFYYFNNYGIHRGRKYFPRVILISSVISLFSTFIGSFYYFVGSPQAIVYYKILYFEWRNMVYVILESLVPLISTQVLISFYLTRRLNSDFKK